MLSGFTDELLEIGILKDIEDFDLNQIVVRQGLKINIRFTSFALALKAFKCLSTGHLDYYGDDAVK